MEFLYVLAWMFLSIFGLVMLLRCAAEELFRDNRRGRSSRKDRYSDMGVGQKRR